MTAGGMALRSARTVVLTAMWSAGCASVVLEEYETCSLDLAPSEAAAEFSGRPGDALWLVGGPLTEVRDTRVEVGGIAAEVVEVVRDEACTACASCREDAMCAPCGLCAGAPLDPQRRVECFGDPLADPPVSGACADCSESLSFVVPSVPPGWTSVYVVNSNGQSEAIPLLVLPGPDTGITDTGPTDTGPADTGPTDTGITDTGPTDTGVSDTGPTDTGTSDTGATVAP